MRNPDIDAFAQARLTPEYQEFLTRIRELMAEHAPDAAEVISSGSPAWRGRRILAIISPSKTHLTFAFERGASFTDSDCNSAADDEGMRWNAFSNRADAARNSRSRLLVCKLKRSR